ncbi:DEAD/DEAH box helicase [Candidatus Kaiserbacteria bacterium]|nr:DEAD/DEAH box helicase [Candidatus Kaiserbacteria bacterium]
MTTHFTSRRAPSRGGRLSHSQARPHRGGSFGRGFRPRHNAPKASRIDVARFVNKSALVEEEILFTPAHPFASLPIDSRIKDNLLKKGYTTPTPIQDQAILPILEGRDVVGIANTGTGKTGAFLIPLLDKVVKKRSERVLIIVPTRELALQIDEEFRGFSQGSSFLSVCTVGGVNISPQIRRMRQDPFFVIGTPGRLKDLIERRVLDLSIFGTVVLDEADRMLDMGFIKDMRFIISRMPKARHTLFFSATLSREIEGLIGDFLKDPVRISVKTGDTAQNVHQDVVRIENGKTKLDVLHDLLSEPEFTKVLVFGRTKHGVEKLSQLLAKRGVVAESIHGNKSQSKRERALALFKGDRIQVLVATDVAARGIDVPDVSHVINYDIPTTYEDYVHRIGRTGRAGKRGKALTFIE